MQNLVRALAVGRIVFGAAMLAAPERAGKAWIGKRAAKHSGTQAVTQGFGARDVALGVGALQALARGQDARTWVGIAALCDVADLGATVARDDLPSGGRALVTALASGAILISAAYLAGGSGGE